MKAAHILIVEDEAAIRTMLRYALEIAGFSVALAEDVDAAKVCLFQKRPNLILLDWMLPKKSGIQFTIELKQESQTQDIPIIFLSAKAAEEDKVRALAVGADDYITKPFSPRELIARVRAVLRRSSVHVKNKLFIFGELQLDINNERVLLESKPIKLAPTEFRLLRFLMEFPNRVHTREKLLTQVWGHAVDVDERTVDVHVRRLRKTLKKYDHLIETVRGSGYRLSDAKTTTQ